MNIALITEGVTDRPIIEAILVSHFTDKLKDIYPTLNSLQPKKKDPGGWLKVLEYCNSQEFKDSFAFNDYIIIQIDSDKHEDKGFDVPKQKTAENLIKEIKNRIIKEISEEFFNLKKDKIIFAISINMIECWFLPFYATQKNHKNKDINCCDTVNQYLKKEGFTIDCKKKEGSYGYHEKASKNLANKRKFFQNYQHNVSLKHFVEVELAKIKKA